MVKHLHIVTPKVKRIRLRSKRNVPETSPAFPRRPRPLGEPGTRDGTQVAYPCNLAGDVEEAARVLSEMQKQQEEGEELVSLVTYNIMFNHLCKFGCYEKAKEVLKSMVERGVVPDSITYGTLITSFSKNNRGGEEVVELHDYMVLNGVRPHEQIYKSLVSPLLKDP
ncbi:Pentatricopeptide repeat protein [Raphanus sativus]|nr:Pentatricopeptide repeat protein [Raphanus sativus]